MSLCLDWLPNRRLPHLLEAFSTNPKLQYIFKKMASEEPEQAQLFSPLLANVNKELIDGVVYQRFWAEIPMTEMLKNLKALEILDDDVITLGFPRSGNHWAYDVVYMIRHQTTKFGRKNFIDDVMESRLSSRRYLEDFEPPRNIVTHVRPGRLPKQALEKRTKVIFLIRNPKDVLVSLYRLYSSMTSEADKFKGTWDQFLDLGLKGQFTTGSWFDHTLEIEKFIDEHPEIPTYVHVYEDMKLNPVENVKNLCAFLEKPDTLVEAIANATRFENMKEAATKFEKANERFFGGSEQEHSGIMRKGQIGGWKDTFTVAQNEKFDRVYKEKMAHSKLGRLIERHLELDSPLC